MLSVPAVTAPVLVGAVATRHCAACAKRGPSAHEACFAACIATVHPTGAVNQTHLQPACRALMCYGVLHVVLIKSVTCRATWRVPHTGGKSPAARSGAAAGMPAEAVPAEAAAEAGAENRTQAGPGAGRQSVGRAAGNVKHLTGAGPSAAGAEAETGAGTQTGTGTGT